MVADLLRSAPSIFVKKLSQNDRDWARLPNKHQAGVYIPPIQRDSGFFPALTTKAMEEANSADIRETFFVTSWPQIEEERKTRLVHYTSKGPETHLTGLPKAAFSALSPASLLVMAPSSIRAETYICLTIDSESDAALLLQDVLGLQADFSAALFSPQASRKAEQDRLLDFADQIISAWESGDIEKFSLENAVMPSTAKLAELARTKYLKESGLPDLNPYNMAAPGDAIRDISRTIEWDLFREFQRREQAVALVRLVLGDEPDKQSPRSIMRALIDNVPRIDALMLSASQQRKSRAGYSFEHHIENMLLSGQIPFEKQVVMDAKKRPDFILPSLKHFSAPMPGTPPGMILSAKTTLRERWKQVQREMGDRVLYLATVDENIAGNAIEDMASMGINLVVPESLKHQARDRKITEYEHHPNVLSFSNFFALPQVAGRWLS